MCSVPGSVGLDESGNDRRTRSQQLHLFTVAVVLHSTLLMYSLGLMLKSHY